MKKPRPPARVASRSRGILLPAIAASAAALGAAALYQRARAHRAERRHPPMGRFITVDGVRVHYMERGHGTPVVLLHGNGAMIEDMTSSGLVERLARNHRVIVFDRPGFGYTARPRTRLWTPNAQARLIAQAMERLGIDRATVYGHSLGTQVAVSLALGDPERVSSLVLASGYFYPTVRLDVPLAASPAIPVVGDVMRYTLSPALARALLPGIYKKLFAPMSIPPRFQREFPHGLIPRPWHLRAAAEDTAFLIPVARDLQHRYATLQMPVTIITGADDKIVTPAHHSLRLNRSIPSSKLVEVPGAGHMIHHLALDQVVQAIEQAGDDHRSRANEDHEHPARTEMPSRRPSGQPAAQAMRR